MSLCLHREKRTPLIDAAQSNQVEMVIYLMSKGSGYSYERLEQNPEHFASLRSTYTAYYLAFVRGNMDSRADAAQEFMDRIRVWGNDGPSRP